MTVRRDGKRRYYQADYGGLGTLKDVLERMWSARLDRLATLAEQAQQSESPPMSTPHDSVTVERRINASPATVFSFLGSSERWLQWQGVETTIELRPVGLFRMNVSGDGFAVGRFLEVIRDRRLVFTWGWEMPDHDVPPGSSTVAIELVPDGSGTLLRLTHTGLPPAWVAPHRQGWQHYIDRLRDEAEHQSDATSAVSITV